MNLRPLLLAASIATVAVGSGDATIGSNPKTSRLTGIDTGVVPAGFVVNEVAGDLAGPTQITRRGDDLLVAQLNGSENAGTGQILRISLDDPSSREVLYDGLLKPTGLAVVEDEIWVMEERSLSRGPVDGGELTTVLSDLPYNGRSEGTLTVTDDGALLYNTSGTLSGVDAAPGSATLWSLVPGEEPTVLATGFKNAYGRTFDDQGTLWQAEMSDGTYDGEPAPDELVVVEAGDDFGWPHCIGDREPVEFYEGTEAQCAATPASFSLFAPGATPTSVATAPWDPDVLLVALWNEGRVVALQRDDDARPAEFVDFLTGIAHPQFLLADDDRLLVVDLDGGRILAVQPAA